MLICLCFSGVDILPDDDVAGHSGGLHDVKKVQLLQTRWHNGHPGTQGTGTSLLSSTSINIVNRILNYFLFCFKTADFVLC